MDENHAKRKGLENIIRSIRLLCNQTLIRTGTLSTLLEKGNDNLTANFTSDLLKRISLNLLNFLHYYQVMVNGNRDHPEFRRIHTLLLDFVRILNPDLISAASVNALIDRGPQIIQIDDEPDNDDLIFVGEYRSPKEEDVCPVPISSGDLLPSEVTKVKFLRNFQLLPYNAYTKRPKKQKYNLRRKRTQSGNSSNNSDIDSVTDPSEKQALRDLDELSNVSTSSSLPNDDLDDQQYKQFLDSSDNETLPSPIACIDDELNALKTEIITSKERLYVDLQPLATYSDQQIDRLCNKYNLNRKRLIQMQKKTAQVKKCERKYRKITLISSTSSDSSISSDIEHQEALQTVEKNTNNSDCGDEYADLICEQMATLSNDDSTSITESNLDSNSDEDAFDTDVLATDDLPPLLVDSETNEIKTEQDEKTRVPSSWSDLFKVAPEEKLNLERRLPSNLISLLSSDEDDIDDNSDVEFIPDDSISDPNISGRRNIRPVLSDENLAEETQRALEEEDEKMIRLSQRVKSMEVLSSSQDGSIVLDADAVTNGPLIKVSGALAAKLKPHQVEGVQFMWNCCYETAKLAETGPGSGCILAHCMGLGKTRQVITLLHTLFTHACTKTRHVLVISPLSTVLNWKHEFMMCLEPVADTVKFPLYFLVNEQFPMKCQFVTEWRKTGGVLVSGYEAYTILTGRCEKILDPKLKADLNAALIHPGPDLIVCDEGHLIKNAKTLRNQALNRIRTKRRILLTGTPLQNNLKEYFYMVQFVRPHLLGTLKEYENRFVNPIMNGQYYNSTRRDVELMKRRTHVLHKLLKTIVHRVESRVLKQYLPDIVDYAIFIRLHPKQAEIYRRFVNRALPALQSKIQFTGFFTDYKVTKYICSHPRILHDDKLLKRTSSGGMNNTLDFNPNTMDDDDNNVLRDENVHCKTWIRNLCSRNLIENIEYGTKMVVLIDIIQKCIQVKDKILIFSSSLLELNCIEYFLSDKLQLMNNVDFYRMDGQVRANQRNEMCTRFNCDETVKILLMSHRVGSLGLNLTGANRIILMGANFNPCCDTQSIYRAFRFGQLKKCYVYRLLALGTMEEKIYQKCIVKLAVSSTVIDKLHVARHFTTNDLQIMYKYEVDLNQARPVPLLPSDPLLANVIQSNENCFRLHEHQALLENRPEEELTDEEKRIAWDEFNTRTPVPPPSNSNGPTTGNTILPTANTPVLLPRPRENFILVDRPLVSLPPNRTPNGVLYQPRYTYTQQMVLPQTSQMPLVRPEFNYTLNRFM